MFDSTPANSYKGPVVNRVPSPSPGAGVTPATGYTGPAINQVNSPSPSAQAPGLPASQYQAGLTNGSIFGVNQSGAVGTAAPPLPAGSSIYGTANSAPRADGQPGLTPTTPVGGYQAAHAPNPSLVARPAGGTTDPLFGNAPLARDQYDRSLALSGKLQGLGNQVQQEADDRAHNFDLAANNFNPTAQSVAPGLAKAPAAVKTSQLGAVPTIQNIQGVANQLGQAPQVGNVGNIRNGAAPGGITGQLGQQGASNADQQGMLGRVNGFLDAPNGPSIAQAQLQQAQADNMGDLIGAARSGRGGAGAQAQALRGALSEGSAIMSGTAGQAATLRAQEEDMLKNRQLSAMGLGGQLAEGQRGQDLAFRGQNLQGLQGDQSTALGARGQDIQTAMANQGTQTALEQLRAQTALGARGQNLSALQGDQGTNLGLQGLAAQTALGARGQNLSALQGNQQTALGARGQDATVGMADADRNLGAQRLDLDAGLGYGALANTAQGQGLDYLSAANQQGVVAQGLANDAAQNQLSTLAQIQMANQSNDTAIRNTNAQVNSQPSFGEQLLLNTFGGFAQGGGQAAGKAAFSDERAKTDISLDSIKASLDDHLRAAPGYSYKYKPGFGEDPDVSRTGPMAQDLERSPFGRDIVKPGPGGYKVVDTSRLALVNHAALASMRSELDNLKARLES